MFLLGLTGSIGMGKSTTAKMFADAGCAVWDADAAVHRLYVKGGAAVPYFKKEMASAVVNDAVSRDVLKRMIRDNPTVLKQIELIVHPLVASDRQMFIENAQSDIIVLDIPLLFETGGDANVDAVVCVNVLPEVQKKRVLERGTMTESEFETIRSKQMPNDEKCARSDYVIETDTLEHARSQVQDVIADIQRKMANA